VLCLATFLETCYCTGSYKLEELSISDNTLTHVGLLHILTAVKSAPLSNATITKLGLNNCSPSVDVLGELAVMLLSEDCAALRVVEMGMTENHALTLLREESLLDKIVTLSDAVSGSRNIAVLTLGELPDAIRKAALRATAGSPQYYQLRIMMDCFRSMLEVLKMASTQQRELLASLEVGQPASVIQLQQKEFEKLRQEHSVSFTLHIDLCK
jgi:hypothetical protein